MDAERVQISGEASRLDEAAWEDSDVVIWSPSSSINADAMEQEIKKIPAGEPAGLLLIHDDARLIDVLYRLKLRAWGMMPTELTHAELLAAVQAIYEGLVVINPTYMEPSSPGKVLRGEEADELVEPLTGRETEILQLLAMGLTNKQIALRLGISAHTVKFHVSAIFAKMQTTNRTETVNLGLKKGLIVL